MSISEIQISVQPTPNPNTLKFVLNKTLLDNGSIEFTDVDSAKKSPLALALWNIEGVAGLLIGTNFVSISKKDNTEWTKMAEDCVAVLKASLNEDSNPLGEAKPTSDEGSSEELQDPDIIKIKKVLDEEIRPAIAADGGDLAFHGYKDGIVTLHLRGACSTCPSSVMTLKMGIENRLKALIPGIKEVVQV